MKSSRMLRRGEPQRALRRRRVTWPTTASGRGMWWAAVGLLCASLGGRASPSRSAEAESPPKVAAAVDGRFLGIRVDDSTRDKFLQNPWLRQAIQDGRRAADAFRRHQLDAISLLEGQSDQTGEPAVLIVLVPKPYEMPDPPFEPITVRRWQPEPGRVYGTEELTRLQLSRPPRHEDLERLRDAVGGRRFRTASSLFFAVRLTLAFVGLGLALIVLAGAYRSFAYVTTRWDRLEDARQSADALRVLKAARARHDEQS